LRGEDSIAEPCRREGIVQNLYYRWSKDFLEAGKSDWLAIRPGPRRRNEVKNLRRETAACSTDGEPRNVINQTSQSLPPFALLAVSKTLMTDT
jgi:transposase-like protein